MNRASIARPARLVFMQRTETRGWRVGLAAILAVLALAVVPGRLCQRHAQGFYDGAPAATEALARGVAHELFNEEVAHATGSTRFDAEWLFGSHMMAAMGFGQLALERQGPVRARHLASMDRCLGALLEPRMQRFDRDAWGHGPLQRLDGHAGHAAYLGYFNLALSLRRKLGPSRFDDVGEAITRALDRRLRASDTLLIETYPGEIYPVDNAAAVASIALRATAEGRPAPPLVARWSAAIRREWLHPETGLLKQRVGSGDPGRGSGTALAAYFLSYADPALSRDLFAALRTHLWRDAGGFGAMREYAGFGLGDIDSGPVVGGLSVSATGFALAGARVHGDRRAFRQLYATAHLFGAPRTGEGRTTYLSGGAIGNAILFAMMTAPRRMS